MRRLLLACILVASVARGDVWKRAVETGKPDAAADKYDFEMKSGDDQTLQANARGITYREVKEHVRRAADSYRAASLAKPEVAEPYFRLGELLYSFYFECDSQLLSTVGNRSILCSPDPSVIDRKRAEEVIAAWNAFEERAPLDPRLSVDVRGDSELLFRRAILHTKLATRDHLLAATKDYERILSRSDSGGDETIWSNLAETYMMLGRLEEAIDTYKVALRKGGGISALYGLAVALDRDDRGAQARDVILSQDDSSKEAFIEAFSDHKIFFVPQGEEFYYFALIEEAFDQTEPAIEHWQRYISSGAHPEFQPRAKMHLAALLAHRKRTPLLKLPVLPDEIFR